MIRNRRDTAWKSNQFYRTSLISVDKQKAVDLTFTMIQIRVRDGVGKMSRLLATEASRLFPNFSSYSPTTVHQSTSYLVLGTNFYYRHCMTKH